MRGANSRQLQAALAAARIAYRRGRELAPTATCAATTSRSLGGASLGPLVSQLPTSAPAALLCVERGPEACHRSLTAGRLEEQFGVTVEHLRAS